jgi:hypothetical protein
MSPSPAQHSTVQFSPVLHGLSGGQQGDGIKVLRGPRHEVVLRVRDAHSEGTGEREERKRVERGRGREKKRERGKEEGGGREVVKPRNEKIKQENSIVAKN